MQSLKFETAKGTVHSWQCDHMGHANLRAYGEFFEQALWHVFHRIGITPSVLRGDSIRMAGVQQSIHYMKELLPGDLVLVKSQLVEMRERSLKMRHEMQHIEQQPPEQRDERDGVREEGKSGLPQSDEQIEWAASLA